MFQNKNLVLFVISVSFNKLTEKNIVFQLCFSRKNTITLGQATAKGFTLGREISVDSLATSLSMECGLICAALANGYYVMINSLVKNSKPLKLCDYDPRDKPRVAHVKKVSRYVSKSCHVKVR